MSRTQRFGTTSTERVLYSSHTAMLRDNPLKFVFYLLLIPLFGIGLLLLLIWWLDCLGTTLTITNLRSILRRGIFSKFTTDVLHQDVRNVQVKQTFLQRIFGVGYVGVSSSAQSGVEIEVSGIPFPEDVRQLIYQCRSGEMPAPAQSTPPSYSHPTLPHTPPPMRDFENPADITPFDRLKQYSSSPQFKDRAQGFLNTFIYLTSFKWISGLPDWAQPICWGLLISVPLVVILVVILKKIL
jgi:hypothetical protein